MKILLITGDTLAPWAITFRAQELKKRWLQDEVDIVPEFNGNPDDYDVVHFLFSGNIGKYFQMFQDHPNKLYTSVVSANTLTYGFDKKIILYTIFSTSRKVICLNPSLQKQVIELIGEQHTEKIIYIPNGVDEKLFHHKFTVGFVGSNLNHDYKGLPLIREACKRLDVELLIHNCHYPDKVTEREDMPAFYRQIDCLCLASLGEGCNNPTLEALVMHKPVISTNTGIAAELPGVILVERTVESIMEGINKLNYRKHIQENYTWDIIAEKYHNLYLQNG